jgi:hypothetical protein
VDFHKKLAPCTSTLGICKSPLGINVYSGFVPFRHVACIIYKYAILARSVSAICPRLSGRIYRSDRWQLRSARVVGQDKPFGVCPLFRHGPQISEFQLFLERVDVADGSIPMRQGYWLGHASVNTNNKHISSSGGEMRDAG